MQAWVLVVGLALLATPLAAPVLADEAPLALRDRIARTLEAHGASFEDLPARVMVYELDLGTGLASAEERPLDEALALFEGPGAGGPSADLLGGPHRVVGDVAHQCLDYVLHCYKFYTNTLGPGTPTRRGDLNDSYKTLRNTYDSTPVDGFVAFPVKGGETVYIQGVYGSGSHTPMSALSCASTGNSNCGVSFDTGGLPGAAHGDRAVWGTGVGLVKYVAVPWGPPGEGKVISLGSFRGHGAWTFCGSETDPACVPAP